MTYTEKAIKNLLALDWKDELRSFVTTTILFIGMFELGTLQALWEGNFTEGIVISLLMGVARSAVKAALTIVFPTLFPARTSV